MRSAVFGPDGSKILTAGEDRSLRVWNAATGELVFSIDDHPSVPTIATFREDGATILSVSEKGGAFIWDGATGAPLHKIRKRVPQTEVLSQPLPVSAKPSLLDHRGSRLVQPLADASFVVWDLDASKELLRHRSGGAITRSGRPESRRSLGARAFDQCSQPVDGSRPLTDCFRTLRSLSRDAESSMLRRWMQHLDRLAKDGAIRINSGETAKTIDSKSEVWTEDAFFDDGSEWRSEAAPKTSPSR